LNKGAKRTRERERRGGRKGAKKDLQPEEKKLVKALGEVDLNVDYEKESNYQAPRGTQYKKNHIKKTGESKKD